MYCSPKTVILFLFCKNSGNLGILLHRVQYPQRECNLGAICQKRLLYPQED